MLMWSWRIITKRRLLRPPAVLPSSATIRKINFSAARSDSQDPNNKSVTLGQITSKYQTFRDDDSEEILDVYEERFKKLLEAEHEQEQPDALEGINLARGDSGVFEIEDLVEVLRRENAADIFVATVPAEAKYVDYICLVSGKSLKHMQAIAQLVRKVYKRKMNARDIIPRLEGKQSKDWLALDLGNIALHIFSNEARALYDLDSLWAIGPKYDAECNKKDPVAEMLENHSLYLQSLQPAS